MNEKFNIIFLVVDALRAENLSCYGYPELTTPNIDAMAERGILFENAYSCIDNTDPSFTSIFSGKYPISHGINHQAEISKKEIQEFRLTQTKLIHQILKPLGYFTIGIDWLGRWHKENYDFYGIAEEVETVHKDSLVHRVGKYIGTLPYPIRSLIRRSWNLIGQSPPPKQEARSLTNLAMNRLKNVQEKNFFLLIHYWDVHTPFDTIPASYVHKFYKKKTNITVKEMLKKIEYPIWKDKVKQYHLKGINYIDEITAKYNSAINFVDHEISRLLTFLKDEGLYEHSLIVLTGDHGDNHMRGGIFVGHSGLYERVIHIPLVLAGGGLPQGKRICGFVQHIDIVPTILDMLGVDSHSFNFDGKSLLSLIHGERKQLRSEVFVMEAARRRFAIRNENYKYIYSPADGDLLHTFWKKRDILFRPVYNNRIELYNLRKDPEESHNIAAENIELAKEMEHTLLEWIKNLETKKEEVILRNRIEGLKDLGKV